METFGNKIQQNSATKKYCDKCDVLCSTIYNYKTHLLSRRHVMETHVETFGNTIQQNSATPSFSLKYECNFCKKLYKTRSGLWKHKNICLEKKDSSKNNITTVSSCTPHDEIDKNSIILKLLDQNANLQNQILELSKEKSTVITHNTIHNNQFNLNVFLNEHCKDALNLMDFINSLELQTSDLETTGKIGYAEGISKIFINGLKELELHKRPIHCSDLKREVFYVKDCNIWEKDNKEKEKIKKAIKIITNKNINQISQWQKENPEYYKVDNKKNDEYMQIVYSAMCGETMDEANKNYEKIIKNVAKEVIINKEKDKEK